MTNGDDTTSRGNPNQARVVQKLEEMGYDVRVIHNQICVPGQEPMTIKMARDFIEDQHAVGRQTTLIY